MFAEVDEVDVSDRRLPFIFGRSSVPSQPQITRFKGVASKSSRFVALLDSEEKVRGGESQCATTDSRSMMLNQPLRVQAVARLGNELPVVVGGDDWEATAEEIDDIFVGEAELWCAAEAAKALAKRTAPAYAHSHWLVER